MIGFWLALLIPLCPQAAAQGTFDPATDTYVGGTEKPPVSAPAKSAKSTVLPSDGRVLPDLEQQRLQALAHSQTEDTQVIWLETNQESFLGLYQPALLPKPKGGVLLLHHDRTSADWPGAIKSLRQGLPDQGWQTLSIAIPDQPSLPVESTLAAEAKGEEGKLLDQHFDQITDRIESGLRHLESQGASHFMVVGVGSGGYWAARYTREFQKQRVSSLVLIDALRPNLEIEPGFRSLIGEIKIPTLDIYHGSVGGREPVEQLARARAKEVRRLGNPSYLQYRIPHKPSDWKRPDRRLLATLRGLIKKKIESARPGRPSPPAVSQEQPPGSN